MMTAATIFIFFDRYLPSKNSGIVLALSAWVIFLVRIAKSFHARKQPKTAFPMPIHIEPMPMSQPCLPA